MLFYFLTRRVERNLLARQLVRPENKLTTWISFLAVILLSTGLMIGLTALEPFGFLRARQSCNNALPWFALWMLEAASGLHSWTIIPRYLVPLIAAIYTTTLISDHVNSPQFIEIRLTPIRNWNIVWGYIWASLFKRRVFIALTLALSINALVRNAVIGLGHCGTAWIVEIRKLMVMFGPVMALCTLVRLWLAVTIGTVLGLQVKSHPAAVVSVVVVFLVIAVGQISTQSWMLSQGMSFIGSIHTGPWLIDQLKTGLSWAILMFGLSWLSILWALHSISRNRTAS